MIAVRSLGRILQLGGADHAPARVAEANVEAEGVQIDPVHRPARRLPGDRPPVTRKGIRPAVPVWLKEAGSDLKTLAYEIKELKDGRFKYPGMAARPAFDAVFFSAMAWCLTRG